MKIENTKDLKKLIQLCRQLGVEAIEVGGVKMNLGPAPVIIKQERKNYKELAESIINQPTYTPGGITEDTQIPTDSLTEEQMLFYSSQGHDNEQHS